MRLAHRSITLAIALLTIGILATPEGLAAQSDDDPCAALLDPLNRQITENWDDLRALTIVLDGWAEGIRTAFAWYEPSTLDEMSAAEVAEYKRNLVALRDCMPGIAVAFDRLKKRIEELQNTPSVVGQEDRLRRHRIEKFRELEQLHREVGEALDSILG